MDKQRNKRNYTVEIWRIVYAAVILGFHYFSKHEMQPFHAGYLGVEFFFLLSGYGLFVMHDNMKLPDYPKFALSRLLRLYPLYLASMFFMLLVKLFTHQQTIAQLPGYIKSCLAEFFMLQCGPLGNEVMIAANWYVAVLFWGSLVWMLLMLIFKKIFSGNLIASLMGLITAFGIYGYYFVKIGKIDVIFSYYAFLRGLAGLGLGIFMAYLSNLFSGIQTKSPKNSRILFAAANFVLLAVVVYTNFGHRSKWDFLIISCFFVCLLILFSLPDPVPESAQKYIKKPASATYPVYLFQMPVIELMLYFHI
ncbi:MAG: acyltransferase family protein [Lachnospiraceae bacterium]|nr:acyltransferase family protein [Lachnospiraceae bacterium]